MTSEIEIYGRDSVRLNILREVLSGEAELTFQLNGGAVSDYRTQIHKAESRMSVYGRFNISEDPSGTVLAVRPVTDSDSLRISFKWNIEPVQKTISIVRGATKTVERELGMGRNILYMEFLAQAQKYMLNVVYSDAVKQEPEDDEFDGFDNFGEPADTGIRSVSTGRNVTPPAQNVPAPAPAPVSEPPKAKQSPKERMERIEAEYQKDYDAYMAELEEIKSFTEADKAVIGYYRDKDVVPVEKLFEEITAKIEEAEKQIKLFIEAKQSKTMEIENEIKANKR